MYRQFTIVYSILGGPQRLFHTYADTEHQARGSLYRQLGKRIKVRPLRNMVSCITQPTILYLGNKRNMLKRRLDAGDGDIIPDLEELEDLYKELLGPENGRDVTQLLAIARYKTGEDVIVPSVERGLTLEQITIATSARKYDPNSKSE